MLFIEACWLQKDKEASQMIYLVWGGVMKAIMSYSGKLSSLQREWKTLYIRIEQTLELYKADSSVPSVLWFT